MCITIVLLVLLVFLIAVDVIIVLIGIWLIFTLFGDAACAIKRLLKRKKDQCK